LLAAAADVSGAGSVSVVVHKCGACELVHIGNPFVLPLELLEVLEFVLWAKD